MQTGHGRKKVALDAGLCRQEETPMMDDIVALVATTLAMLCGLAVCVGLMIYLLNQQKMKHKERLALIEKGIYVEAKKQESGVPSLAVIMLVGIGLATLMVGHAEFLGFALLFIGVGLIVRDRLLRHKKHVTGRLQSGRLGTGGLEDTRPKQQDQGQEPWA
jgi:hypothetical protein